MARTIPSGTFQTSEEPELTTVDIVNGENEAKSANVFLSDDVFEKDKTFYPDFIPANNQCGPNENNVLEGITDKNKKDLTNEVLF